MSETYEFTSVTCTDLGHSRPTYPVLVSVEIAASVAKGGCGDTCQVGANRRQGKPGCGEAVRFVRVRMPTDARFDNGLIPSGKNVGYCQQHGEQLSRNNGLLIIDSLGMYQAYRKKVLAHYENVKAEREKAQAADFKRQQREFAERKQQIMEEHGRMQAMAGKKGGLFEYPDGSYKAQLHSGELIDVCCWYQGQHVIEHCYRGRVSVPAHTQDCPERDKGNQHE